MGRPRQGPHAVCRASSCRGRGCGRSSPEARRRTPLPKQGGLGASVWPSCYSPRKMASHIYRTAAKYHVWRRWRDQPVCRWRRCSDREYEAAKFPAANTPQTHNCSRGLARIGSARVARNTTRRWSGRWSAATVDRGPSVVWWRHKHKLAAGRPKRWCCRTPVSRFGISGLLR